MFAIAVVILLLAALEFPVFLWICQKKGIRGLWRIALWALAVYLGHSFVLAVAFRLWAKLPNSGAIVWQDFLWQSGFIALYGSVLFLPIYLLFTGLAYWYLQRD